MAPKKSLLIVDDSLVARMFIKKHFKDDHEWQIFEAENSSQTLEILKNGPCDVISIDYNMPGVNGLDLADSILKLYPSIKIAMVTANIQNSLRVEVEKRGIVFLEKPITMKTIESLKQL